MKIIVTIIPTDLVTNLFLSSFFPFLQTKNKNLVLSNYLLASQKINSKICITLIMEIVLYLHALI